MRRALLILTAFLTLLTGCGSVISKAVLKETDRSIVLEMVQGNPELYRGRKVLWGGVIIRSENLESSTEIEVLETGLSWNDMPSENESRGRFLIEAMRYLDTALFKEGRMITVAGTVKGVETRKIGKMDYPYPVITPVEIRLFDPPFNAEYREMPPPWWYNPYWPYNPRYPWPPSPGYPFYPYPYPY